MTPIINATASLFQQDSHSHAGTAWLCSRSHALTAAHCVTSPGQDQLNPGIITLKFPWGLVTAKVIWHHLELDAALLELEKAITPEVAPLRLSSLPTPFALPITSGGRGWYSYGFPRAQSSGLHLTGTITSTEGNVGGNPAIQLDCDQGGLGYLEGASGSAVCHNDAAVALIRHGLLNQMVILATAVDRILAACPVSIAAIDGGVKPAHPLHDFPRGPAPDENEISNKLILTYARLHDTGPKVRSLIRAAVRLRREADPGDPHVTVMALYDLPDVGIVGALAFWTDAFHEACNHGPRMLAALLLVQPDELFALEAKKDRAALLKYLGEIE